MVRHSLAASPSPRDRPGGEGLAARLGETVEEEDFAENLSDDDPTYANDQKL